MAADEQEQFHDRPAGVGGQHLGEQVPAVGPQRVGEQVRLGGEVRVQRAVAHPGGRGDVGHPGAVVAAFGEHVGGRAEQPLPGLCGRDARDAPHRRIKRTFIRFVKGLAGLARPCSGEKDEAV